MTNEAAAVAGTRFGANCYDLFYLPFLNGLAARNPRPRLQLMKDLNFPFVRFSASAYWPNDWNVWEKDKGRYLATLDAVFEAAERVGMPLVPCVMWAPFGLSDHLGERYSAWGDAQSRTRHYFAEYVPQIVERYRSSPSLWMWEFANEMNSFANLPTGDQWFPPVNQAQGTFDSRNAQDRISWIDVESASAAFISLLRGANARQPASTGHSIPRYNQMQNGEGLWSPDSKTQLASALTATIEPGYDVMSVHIYPDSTRNRFTSVGATVEEMLMTARKAADAKSAKLFVGEFGVSRSNDVAADKANFSNMIASMKAARVDYAAFWAFDYWDTNGPFNVTPTNDRSWMLDMISEANA